MQLRETKIGELKKPHLYMMSIESPSNTAALSDFSFLFKGDCKQDDSPLATQIK